jgi:predicted MFS family arabinose efflux permease
MALAVTIGGAVIAPLAVAENQVLQRVPPEASITEAFTWVVMATVLGLAASNAVGGVIVDSRGWRAALLAGAAVPAMGALLTFARRRTLS